ncbi:hypothetical protein KKH27_13790 [bacterium]|nr:hypothetical protein [bacterium]
MSFTSLEIVKKHLLQSIIGELEIRRHPVMLPGLEEIQLPHQNLVPQSDVVKRDVEIEPALEGPLTLASYNWSVLNATHLVEGSTVVTLSDGLETVYREEVDYQVDSVNGRLRRVPGTSIPDGQTVYAYYYAYNLFVRDTDYEMDSGDGTVKRTSGSSIPDGATVLVDYTVVGGVVPDVLIEQAIVEAKDRIVRALAPGYNPNSTDQGLETGATELVLAILARDQANGVLAGRATSDAAGRAKGWQTLSELLEVRAWRTLAPFLDPYVLRSPGKQSNE